MTPVEDPAIVFASAQLILLYLGTAAVAFPTRSRHVLLAKDLVTWQAVVGRHILEALLGESRNDRVSQEIAPHTVVMPLDNKCRNRWPVRLQTRVRWSSALRLNWDSSTSPVCHTPSCPRSAKSSGL
ncbi:hypothetical protein TNCV_952801 [Trichonephila clavipes]|nr:hypothetical protein TNCV_952801 [Trichonephila clavipes]